MEPSILTTFWGPLSKLKRFIYALSDLGLTSNKVTAFREDKVLSCGQVVTLRRIRKSHMCLIVARLAVGFYLFTAGLISTKRV